MAKMNPRPSEASSRSSSSSSSSSQFKGVRKRSWGKFVSEIRIPNSRERIWLGSFSTAEQAARAYDAAAICLRGSSASLNLPDFPNPHLGWSGLTKKDIQSIATAAAKALAPVDPASECSSLILVSEHQSTDHSDCSPFSVFDFATDKSETSPSPISSEQPHSLEFSSDYANIFDDLNVLDELPPFSGNPESADGPPVIKDPSLRRNEAISRHFESIWGKSGGNDFSF